jgi:hypothetical protein
LKLYLLLAQHCSRGLRWVLDLGTSSSKFSLWVIHMQGCNNAAATPTPTTTTTTTATAPGCRAEPNLAKHFQQTSA